MHRPSTRRIATATVLAGLTVAGCVAPAVAADPPTLTVQYDASGSTTLRKPAATVPLGPTSLTPTLNLDTAKFRGSLPLPDTTAAFTAPGHGTVSSTVTFVPVGVVTGRLDTVPVVTAHATAVYVIELSDVVVGGRTMDVGDSCVTFKPVTIQVDTPRGQVFNVFSGGTVAGTYTLPHFTGCRGATALINSLVPDVHNTVTFTLSNGHVPTG